MRLMPRISAPVPSAMIVKLPYSKTGQLTTLVNGTQSHWTMEINANSIYRPEVGVSTAQPRWRDQWANIFGRYYVRSCTVKIKIMNTANSFGAWFYTVIVPYRQSAGAPYLKTLVTADEMDNVKEIAKRPGHRFYPKLHKPPGNGTGLIAYDSRKIVPAFYLDGRDRQTDNSAAMGADPPQPVRMDVNLHALVDNNARTHYYEVMVEYEVCVYEPNAIAQG